MVNWFFIHLHPFYKFLYFIYKRILDREDIFWMRGYLKKGMSVVDVGANIGFYSLLLSNCVGKEGRVYSLEPDKVNFRFLKKNTKDRKNIQIFNLAVGNQNTPVNLYLSRKFNMDHQTYDANDTKEKKVIKKVKCTTLDKFFGLNKKIDFIKMDIEGFDYFAILGARNLIKRQKRIALVGELWPYGLHQAGVETQEYLNLLKKLKLKVILKTTKNLDKLNKTKKFYTNFIAYK